MKHHYIYLIVAAVIIIFIPVFYVAHKGVIPISNVVIPNVNNCDYNSDSSKYYQARSAEECTRSFIRCVDSQIMFGDECGCGCQSKSSFNDDSFFNLKIEEGWGPCPLGAEPCARQITLLNDGHLIIEGSDIESYQLTRTAVDDVITLLNNSRLLSRSCSYDVILDYWKSYSITVGNNHRLLRYPSCEDQTNLLDHAIDTLIDSHEPARIDSADWDVLRNDTLGITMKYPPDWQVLSDASIGTQEIVTYEISGFAVQTPENVGKMHTVHRTRVSINNPLGTAESFRDMQDRVWCSRKTRGECTGHPITKKIIIADTIVLYTASGAEGFLSPSYYYLHPTSNEIIQISAESYPPTSDIDIQVLRAAINPIMMSIQFHEPVDVNTSD